MTLYTQEKVFYLQFAKINLKNLKKYSEENVFTCSAGR